METVEVKIRILLAAKDRGLRDKLRQMIVSDSNCEIVSTAYDGLEAVEYSVLDKPDVAIIDDGLQIYNGLQTAENIGLRAPDVNTVIIGHGQPDEYKLKHFMVAGVKAYIDGANMNGDLHDALKQMLEQKIKKQQIEDVPAVTKIIAVTGGRGGIGKSTVASGLAMCLAQRFPGEVVLFDVYTQFGDISTMLDVNAPRSLCEAMERGDKFDLESLESYMAEHEIGLKVLISSRDAASVDALQPDLMEATLLELKRKYRYVVLDLPPILHPTMFSVLSLARNMIIVTNRFELQTVNDGKKLFDIVKSRYIAEEHIEIVINRISKYDNLTTQDVETAFGKPVLAEIPNQPKLINAVNRGRPFVSVYSRSKLVQVMEQMADKLSKHRISSS